LYRLNFKPCDFITKYAILFGFGLFDESNSKYKDYLDRFVKFVKKKEIDEIVLCGGHTDITQPDKSEAKTMADYITQHLESKVKIHIEDMSITTEQNITFAKNFIDLDNKNKIFVISDGVRFFKIMWILLDRWFGLSKEGIIDNWFNIVQQIYSNPKKKDTTMELKDIKPFLKYENVKIIVDNHHKDYRNSMHTIISEPLEIEGLYDQKVYEKLMYIAKRKFKMV
jgi:hypothetical protein